MAAAGVLAGNAAKSLPPDSLYRVVDPAQFYAMTPFLSLFYAGLILSVMQIVADRAWLWAVRSARLVADSRSKIHPFLAARFEALSVQIGIGCSPTG